MAKNEVTLAFEILLEEIESVVDSLNREGASVFQRGDYEAAKQLIEDATRITDLRERIKTLQKEWQNLFAARVPRKTRVKRKKRTYKKLQRGLRTPEDAFRQPILEALTELGGSASMNQVLELVEKKMQGILNEYDYQSLPSNPKEVRWRNTAQWCRNTLVREGLLRSDSPRGIWEISDEGREVLKSELHTN